jgi:hypothetical protein
VHIIGLEIFIYFTVFTFFSTCFITYEEAELRNTKIRNQLKQESVEVQMEKRTLRWYGHAVRIESERKLKLVPEARPEAGRGKGRPRVEWEEYVEGLARKRGRRLPEVR